VTGPARARLSAWIEDYNTRRHSALGMMSPVDYEHTLQAGKQPEMPCFSTAQDQPVPGSLRQNSCPGQGSAMAALR